MDAAHNEVVLEEAANSTMPPHRFVQPSCFA